MHLELFYRSVATREQVCALFIHVIFLAHCWSPLMEYIDNSPQLFINLY